MGKLENKVAVITGGSTGIGLATAKLFVREGAYVFITGRRQKELDEAVKAIGRNVTAVQGDVAKLADLDRLYETVRVKGRIDIVFANAGVVELAPLGSITEQHFDKLFNINVRGTLFTVQKALPLLNDGGSIILTGSVAGVKGTPAFGVYGASKAAVRNLVRAWTVELKDRHIRSNVLSPGPTETPVISQQPADAIARIVSTIPMGAWAKPMKSPRRRCFSPRMTPVSSRASNFSLTAAGRRFDPADAHPMGGFPMRSDIVPGAIFPDYELSDHTAKRRKLSELQGQHPMVLVLSRGGFCPKDRRQAEGLVQLHRELEVAYCRLVTISTDNITETNEYRSGVGAHWPFLSDAGRVVQKNLDIAEYTDPVNNPMIPHVIVLEPGLVIYKIYNGYWFFGRPTLEELRQDLRAVTRKCRPDWDITTPELKAAWQQGRKDLFYPYGKNVRPNSRRTGLGAKYVNK